MTIKLFKTATIAGIIATSLFFNSAKADIQSAVTGPNADLYGHINFAEISSNALYKKLKDSTNKSKSPEEELFKLTGLKQEDFSALYVAFDLDSIDFAKLNDSKEIQKISGVIGLSLKKQFSLDKIVAIYNKASKDTNEYNLKNDGKMIQLTPKKDTEEPEIFISLSKSGKGIFFSFNKASLLAASKREGGSSNLSKKLKGIIANCSKSQAAFAFIPSSKQTKVIQQNVTKALQNPNMAMMAGLISPFQKFNGLFFKLNFSDKMDIKLSSIFGADADATKLIASLQAFLPMLMMGQNPNAGFNPLTKLKLTSKGKVANFDMTLTESELNELSKKALKK